MAARRPRLTDLESHKSRNLSERSSASRFSNGIFRQSFRSALSRDHLIHSIDREGRIVYNWNSRGYDPRDPHPAYGRLSVEQDPWLTTNDPAQVRHQKTRLKNTTEFRLKPRGGRKYTQKKVDELTDVICDETNLSQQIHSWLQTGECTKAIGHEWHRDLLPDSETSSISTFLPSIFDSGNVEERSVDGKDDNDALPSDISLYLTSTLPCEFFGFSGCDQTFDIHAVDSWIKHIVSKHLKGCLPVNCVCWFCDKVIFSCKHNYDPMKNFENRMWHIHSHIRDGFTIHDMRPDFYLLGHLYNHKLIPAHAYYSVLRYTELRRPNHVHSFDFSPPEAERLDEISKTILVSQGKEDRARRRRKKEAIQRGGQNRKVGRTHALNSSLASQSASRLNPPLLRFYEDNQTKADIQKYSQAGNSGHIRGLNILDFPSRQLYQPEVPGKSFLEHIKASGSDTVKEQRTIHDSLRSRSEWKVSGLGRMGATSTKGLPTSGKKDERTWSSICRMARLRIRIPSPGRLAGLYRLFWPKRPRELIRVSWICRCGQPLYVDVHPKQEQLAMEYAQAASGSVSSVTVSGATTSTASPIQTPTPPPSTITQPGPASFQVQSGNAFTPPALARGTKKYLLLCVNTGYHQIKLEQIDLTDIVLDVSMFSLIRDKYESMRGPRIRNVFLIPKTVEYIKFELVRRSSTGECVGNYEKNSIPSQIEVAKKEYTFSPCPPRIGTMPIQPHLFMHSFLNPGDHLGELAVLQLPKKVGRKLKCVTQPMDPFDVPYGWGIYIVEGLDTVLLSFLLAGVLALVTLIVLLWSTLRSDVQGGTGIGQYGLAALGTVVAIGALTWESLGDLTR